MKKRSPEQELNALCRHIRQEIKQWESINQYGCNDPFWPDGINMNLKRNHILYDKRRIMEIYEKYNIALPEEIYLPTPPEVDDYYMASLKNKRRIQRISNGEKLTTKRNKYDSEQLSLF